MFGYYFFSVSSERRGAAVLPWDREDKRHRLNDGRAYDVGLSDDAGAANNLGLATSQACELHGTSYIARCEFYSSPSP